MWARKLIGPAAGLRPHPLTFARPWRTLRAMGEQETRPISDSERLDRLRLIRSENVGPITFFRLLEHFGSAEAALNALPDLAQRGGRERRIKICARTAAEQELEAYDGIGARLVALGEPDYPPLLAQIEDAPPLISVKGHLPLLKKRAVAVVGARNASINGCKFARTIAADLGHGGLLVVSGLARGIDAAAHEGALETGTVAVVAGGVDVIYPKENAALYDAINDCGAILSEVPPGIQPQARHFPRRNRLISGLSRGVVVIEASMRSGSLITARMAAEQGREVFAVPGSPIDPRSAGANDLIRQGALLTESADHVIETLTTMLREHTSGREPIGFSDKTTTLVPEDETVRTRLFIEAHVDSVPIEVDELLSSCQYAPSVVLAALLELELAGRLERHPGNRISLIR